MKILKVFKSKHFFVLLILISPAFFLYSSLKVERVYCFSQFGSCSEKLNNELKVFEGKKMFNAKKEVEKSLDNNFTIESYGISYKFPSSFELRVLEKKPKFAVEVINSDKDLILVDKEGMVISSSKNTDIPKLVLEGDLSEPGKTVDKKMLFALNLLFDTYTSYQVKEGVLEDDSLVIELPGEVRVIFPLEGDREVLSGSLILLYNQITRKDGKGIVKTDTNIDTIDLRFKNPILKSR